jgi:tetratricopeptide (TPR) repeat protein
VGLVVKHPFLLAIAALVAATPLEGQLPEGEDAFRRGDHRAARAAFERVLAEDSLNVRALYRLATLDSWDGKFARSLARFEVLRRLEPVDDDIAVAHARVLAWANKNRESEALYDSVLTRAPARTDALAGRARAVAWAGELDRAERLWREALDAHPDDAEILIGLAQTLFWKGQPQLAEAYVARARQLAPEDRAARDLLDLVRAAVRPEASTSLIYAHDSDDNAFVAQDGSFTTSLGPDFRATVHAGWRRATDPARTGASYGAGAYAVTALGKGAVLRAGLGARRLAPDTGGSKTAATVQLGVGIRPARYASLGVAYSRNPFDETALLIDSAFAIDALDFSADVAASPRVSLSGGGGVAWLSDGNRRTGAVGAVMVSAAPGLQTGILARIMGYHEPNPGRGYFAPDRFSVVEARAVYAWRRVEWGVRADGGVGWQQVGSGAPGQAQWHAGFALTRTWRANSEAALLGSITNSAASRSGAGAAPGFRFWSIGARLRLGL